MGEMVTRVERKRKKKGGRQKSQGTPQGQQRSRLETLLPSRSRPFQLLGDSAKACNTLFLLFHGTKQRSEEDHYHPFQHAEAEGRQGKREEKLSSMLLRSSKLLSCAAKNCTEVSPTHISQFSSENFPVHHDKRASQFYVKIGKDKATIQYEKLNSTLDLQHTDVPEVFQGKGLGKILAKGAFDYVVTHKLKMKLSCDYLQSYYEKNPLPEYSNSIVV
uniref:Protein NATD1 n=1 Tax=Timema shepardi TaxID=629360 RepID=A0A7R9ARA0_TIMSH|nr:unnamed protein product [Timema shepardi]